MVSGELMVMVRGGCKRARGRGQGRGRVGEGARARGGCEGVRGEGWGRGVGARGVRGEGARPRPRRRSTWQRPHIAATTSTSVASRRLVSVARTAGSTPAATMFARALPYGRKVVRT